MDGWLASSPPFAIEGIELWLALEATVEGMDMLAAWGTRLPFLLGTKLTRVEFSRIMLPSCTLTSVGLLACLA